MFCPCACVCVCVAVAPSMLYCRAMLLFYTLFGLTASGDMMVEGLVPLPRHHLSMSSCVCTNVYLCVCLPCLRAHVCMRARACVRACVRVCVLARACLDICVCVAVLQLHQHEMLIFHKQNDVFSAVCSSGCLLSASLLPGWDMNALQ